MPARLMMHLEGIGQAVFAIDVAGDLDALEEVLAVQRGQSVHGNSDLGMEYRSVEETPSVPHLQSGDSKRAGPGASAGSSSGRGHPNSWTISYKAQSVFQALGEESGLFLVDAAFLQAGLDRFCQAFSMSPAACGTGTEGLTATRTR